MKRWALITGASSGIGLELARLFAQDGWSVALTARNEARLRQLAAELESRYRVQTRVLVADLSDPGAPEKLFRAAEDLAVEALVNNAGFGQYGLFADVPLDIHKSMVQVNISAMVELTHRFLAGMRARKKGIILNVGSLAAFQPGPTVDIYYATKAFVYSFSYALAVELEGSGVTVTVLNPGTTRTEFFERAKIHLSRPYPLMDPQQVAVVGYRAAMRGRRSATPGFFNRLISLFSPCLPSRLTSAAVAKIHGSGSAAEQ